MVRQAASPVHPASRTIRCARQRASEDGSLVRGTGRGLSLPVSSEEWERLAPYLPFGLVLSDAAGPIERAQGLLKRMLLTLRLHPGQKVPLDVIAAELSVSRTPVREAMRLLEGEGLVRALPNRGFAVQVTSIDETAHLFDARACIEATTAVAAFDRRTDAFLDDIRAIEQTYRRILTATMNRRIAMVCDKAFHLRISEQAGNPVLTDMQRKLFDAVTFTRALDGFPVERSAAAIAEHEEILEALQGSSRERVRKAALANVTRGRDSIIAYRRATSLEPG
jgi:DNA-binding GntR family transcriptional regulator